MRAGSCPRLFPVLWGVLLLLPADAVDPISYYLLPNAMSASPANFWCTGSGSSQTVCGTGGCTSGCLDFAISEDNSTTTVYKAITSSGGSTGAVTLKWCFPQGVMPQEFYASVSNQYHSRLNWTARHSSTIDGAYTVVQAFANTPFKNPFTFQFSPPTVGRNVRLRMSLPAVTAIPTTATPATAPTRR
jgi:hypothetical protein